MVLYVNVTFFKNFALIDYSLVQFVMFKMRKTYSGINGTHHTANRRVENGAVRNPWGYPSETGPHVDKL